MTTLTFREEDHAYFVDGLRYPSVTQVLAPLVDFSKVPAAALEKARQEGSAVHKLVELDCAGTLDVDALPEWIKPAYSAWCAFKGASGFSLVLSEHKGFHPTAGYAGTLDLLCELPKLKGWKGVSLLDVKRSLLAGPVIGYQLAAYKSIVEADKGMPRIARRGALRIGNDGRFVLQPFDKVTDYSRFLACLGFFRAQEECRAAP